MFTILEVFYFLLLPFLNKDGLYIIAEIVSCFKIVLNLIALKFNDFLQYDTYIVHVVSISNCVPNTFLAYWWKCHLTQNRSNISIRLFSNVKIRNLCLVHLFYNVKVAWRALHLIDSILC